MIDSNVQKIMPLASRKQRDVMFKETEAVCAQCGNRLGIYYCESGIYLVRCAHCEILSLVRAKNPKQAAARVGLIAIPLDDWVEDDGEVVALKFPIEDDTDICIGHPLTIPCDIPKEFTHFYKLIVPMEPAEGKELE